MASKDHFSKKILVADDLLATRNDLVKILKDIGFANVDEAVDGKQAWEKLSDQAFYGDPYDFIITDIHMPHLTGLALLAKARGTKVYNKTPIVMVSTENEKDIIISAISQGATSYFLKPFDPILVKERLLSILMS